MDLLLVHFDCSVSAAVVAGSSVRVTVSLVNFFKLTIALLLFGALNNPICHMSQLVGISFHSVRPIKFVRDCTYSGLNGGSFDSQSKLSSCSWGDGLLDQLLWIGLEYLLPNNINYIPEIRKESRHHYLRQNIKRLISYHFLRYFIIIRAK